MFNEVLEVINPLSPRTQYNDIKRLYHINTYKYVYNGFKEKYDKWFVNTIGIAYLTIVITILLMTLPFVVIVSNIIVLIFMIGDYILKALKIKKEIK